MSAEGGVQPREYLAKYAAERVRNIGGAWLGVTLGCCECHDHKYDPFLTRDFYRMEAFFADIQERGLYSGSDFGPMMPVPSPDQAAQQERLEAEIARVQAELDAPHPELESEQAEWERSALESVDWTPLQAIEVKAANGTTLTIQPDGSILASGTRPASETYTLRMKGAPEGVTALRLEVLPDDTLPQRGPGRADNGNFVLSEFSASVHRETDQTVALANASATFEQTQGAGKLAGKAYSASQVIDGEKNGPKGWAILGAVGKGSSAVFETSEDIPGGPESVWTFTLAHDSPFAGHAIGRFRLWATRSPRPVKAQGSGLPDPVRQALAVAKAERNEGQKQVLSAHYRSIAPALAPIREKRAALEKQKADLSASITTMVQTRHVEPRPIRVLARGNWMDDSGEVVEPGVPAVLPQPEVSDRRLTRLDLARWLVSPENPLTARALANRLWKLTFGEGLSRKLDDLGSQGEWPSHPELLDWLAGQLIDSGWDIKATLRLIVLSGDLPSVVCRLRRGAGRRPHQPLAGPSGPVPARRRADSRQRAEHLRPAGRGARRPQHQAVSAARLLVVSELPQAGVAERLGPIGLSSGPLHSLAETVPLPQPHGVRRPQPGGMHR